MLTVVTDNAATFSETLFPTIVLYWAASAVSCRERKWGLQSISATTISSLMKVALPIGAVRRENFLFIRNEHRFLSLCYWKGDFNTWIAALGGIYNTGSWPPLPAILLVTVVQSVRVNHQRLIQTHLTLLERNLPWL